MAELDFTQTIVAIGSGLASAPRGIVRISGAGTSGIIERLVLPAGDVEARAISQWLAGRGVASARECRCAVDQSGRWLMMRVYYWPTGRSFTGEPAAEFHGCGALPLLECLVTQIVSLGGRLAERGEFTLRSFLAGKVDLLQAEAVLGVIQAAGDEELQLALGQLGGNLSRPVRALRDQLLQLTAHVEAGLDFVEEDIEFITGPQLLAGLAGIRTQLLQIARQLRERGTGARHLEVVLVGAPNAGKSSLFNALLGESRAIVSDIAGTTRDAISASVQCGGLSFQVTDTAGMEDLDDDTPRGLAQAAMQSRLRSADLLLLCVDTSRPLDAAELDAEISRLKADGRGVLVAGTKADTALDESMACRDRLDALVTIYRVETIDALREGLVTALSERRRTSVAEALHHTAIRCVASIGLACTALDRAERLIDAGDGEELVANELRCVLDDLAAIIGEVHSDTILGEIFGRFCIGK